MFFKSKSSNEDLVFLAIRLKIPITTFLEIQNIIIELDRKSGAVYRSENRGESWKKMSNTVSGGTGPHYYQELYASPHKFDRLYLMNVRILTSEDGGKTFNSTSKDVVEWVCIIYSNLIGSYKAILKDIKSAKFVENKRVKLIPIAKPI